MPAVTNTEEIAAPIEDAWARITDLAKSGDWNVIHVDFPEGPPNELTVGTKFKENVTIMGMPGLVDWTVKAVDEPTTLELEGDGPMGTKVRGSFKLESAGDSTRVTYETEFGGDALAAMAAPLENAARQASEQTLAKLKSLLGG